MCLKGGGEQPRCRIEKTSVSRKNNEQRKYVEMVICPVCNREKNLILVKITTADFDQSSLYRKITVFACDVCGHVFNHLTEDEKNNLLQYYQTEYAPANLANTNSNSDRPGSNNAYSVARYEQLFNVLKKHASSTSVKILDIGCATGGFLRFLESKGFVNLCGIDIIDDYVNIASKVQSDKVEFKKGFADDIPYDNNQFDVIVIDQVFEHSIDLHKVFKEIKRVIKSSGILCVGMPNAEDYKQEMFFEYYWFLLREHLHHFSKETFAQLACHHGFRQLATKKLNTSMLGDAVVLPNLISIFSVDNPKSNSYKNDFTLKKSLINYLKTSERKSFARKKAFTSRISETIPLAFWGMGREFLYLYERLQLSKYNVSLLLDTNPFKQETRSIANHSITEPLPSLGNLGNGLKLFITAFAYEKDIVKNLNNLNKNVQFVHW
jgi:ubiquinone/menaquinone biosynthesis C-methylase UbiE/rubredoxin